VTFDVIKIMLKMSMEVIMRVERVRKTIVVDGVKVVADVLMLPFQGPAEDVVNVRPSLPAKRSGDGHKRRADRRRKPEPDMSHLKGPLPTMPDTSTLQRLRSCDCSDCQSRLTSILTDWRSWL